MSHDWGGDVGMGFDASWNHDFPAGIDGPPHIIGDRAGSGHCYDFFPLDRDVPIADTPRRNNLAATDH
jgi:hypothetical protein